MHVDQAATPPPGHSRVGRPRDDSRDEAILGAALQLLAELGYDGMTMDAVATRAGASKATMYRRWPSKSDLAVEAVGRVVGGRLVSADVPDTGSLAGDLQELERLRRQHKGAHVDELVPGVMAEVRRDPDLATKFHDVVIKPKIDQVRDLLERAQQRGEIPPGRDLDLLSEVVPALITYRKVITGRPTDRSFASRALFEVLLPLATAPPVQA